MGALVQLYNWSPKNETIESQHGAIGYLEYLEKEQTRIEKAPGRIAEVMVAAGRCSLWVDDVRDSRYRVQR